MYKILQTLSIRVRDTFFGTCGRLMRNDIFHCQVQPSHLLRWEDRICNPHGVEETIS